MFLDETYQRKCLRTADFINERHAGEEKEMEKWQQWREKSSNASLGKKVLFKRKHWKVGFCKVYQIRKLNKK